MFFTFSILAYFAILLSILFNPCYLIPVLVAFFFFLHHNMYLVLLSSYIMGRYAMECLI